MENHGIGTHNDKNCVLIVQLEIPQIPYNLLGPPAQIGQLFGIFFKKALIRCPLSMAVGNQIVKSPTAPYLAFQIRGCS